MKFLTLWDLPGYSERTMSKIRGLLAKNEHFEANNKIVSEIIAQLCLENSIQTLLNFLRSTPQNIRMVCMESQARSWGQFSSWQSSTDFFIAADLLLTH